MKKYLVLFLLIATTAIAQLPPFDTALRACSGSCDLTAYTGPQHVSSSSHNLTITANTHVKLGFVTVLTDDVIHISATSSISGPPSAVGSFGATATTVSTGAIIRANANFAPGALVLLDGSFASLHNVTVDGNQAANSGRQYVAVMITQGRTLLDTVTVIGSPSHGILINSTPTGQEAAGGRIVNSFSGFNNGTGLYVVNTNDIFVSLSEFEVNDEGIVLQDSSGTRIQQCDISGSTRDGLTVIGINSTAFSNHVIGNQFGNNRNNDLIITGKAGITLISANAFIGSAVGRNAGTWGILDLGNTGLNTITSNNLTHGAFTYGCISQANSSNVTSLNLCATN